MADRISTAQRSRNMSAIRSKDTIPEQYIRKLFFSIGLRYRKNNSAIFGHPDLLLSKQKTAVFVNGCFWHRHTDCKFAYTPKSHIDYWIKKFQNNVSRDIKVRERLKSSEIKCLIIWECTVKRMMKDASCADNVIDQVQNFILSSESFLEI